MPSLSPRVGVEDAAPADDAARARVVARIAADLAATSGSSLPDDLRLWSLAGGRPQAGRPPAVPSGHTRLADGDRGDGPPAGRDEVAREPGDGGADLAAALEVATGARQRRANGLHVTPRWLADHLVGLALDGLDRTPAVAVCDPACGGGAFLVAAARRLRHRGVDRRRIVRDLLWGADIDPVGVAVAEAALALWAGEPPPPGRLVVGDPLATGIAVWPDPPAAGFDVVVGNPPFQSQLARATARSSDEQRRLRSRFGAAVRAYTDAAWLFLLLGCEIARPGGRVALVEPQSLVGARDAAPVRGAVDRRARLRALWVDGRPVFAAGVRVCAPVLEVVEPSARTDANAWTDRLADAVGVPPIPVAASGGATLAARAEVIAGFRDEYYGLVGTVRELAPGDDDTIAALVTSGAIDWLASSWAIRPARFAKRRWRAPVVDLPRLDSSGSAAARRWVRRTRVPKVLVATQTRVVEVAVDESGTWVPSVPVLAVVPGHPGDLWHLAAALASPAATAWLLRRAPGTALARGALKVAAPELAALPLPAPAGQTAWDAAARAARAFASGRSPAALEAFLAAAGEAYGTPPSLTTWWRTRAGQPR